MGGRLDPRVAAVRVAVRADLTALLASTTSPRQPDRDPVAGRVAAPARDAAPARRPLVLVACSGGADSTALAAAVAFEAPRLGLWAGAVTVDHGLQDGSADRAAALADLLRGFGLDPVVVRAVEVTDEGSGPEAAARSARYRALADARNVTGAAAVLLGHTRDDQAETVLLGLARGSGTRSLAGMRALNGPYRRPLLGLDRATTHGACTAAGLAFWTDPHNADERFTRSRVRNQVLPVLERELGPGITAALARTADQACADADALDALAAAERGHPLHRRPNHAAPVAPVDGGLDAARLAAVVPAIRSRVLRSWLLEAGAPATDLRHEHVLAVEALVSNWHGQRYVAVPGGLAVTRADGRLGIGPLPAVAG